MGFRTRHQIPDLGVGVGFRTPHEALVLRERPRMDWFEIVSENFMIAAEAPRRVLAALRSAYPTIPHGVSLSIGSMSPIDDGYVSLLRELVRRVDAPWCSDHLCWTGMGGIDVHDLLPMPYTREAVAHVVERVKRVQGTLEVPFALENASSYMTYRASTMPEHEFLAEVAERADCGILLDCNNVYVTAYNHGFDANTYIDGIPADRVVQMHLAGHTDKGTHLLDTHSDHVKAEVWELYRRAIRRCGAISTLVEWDEQIPAWDVLSAEAARARDVRREVLAERDNRPEARAT